MNTNKFLARLALLSLAAIGTSVIASEPVKVKSAEELAKPCQACHGADGNATAAIYPHLAGQYADYLARALHEYRDGGRVNPIMGVYVETLTDQDIKILADYFSAMPGKLDDLHGRMEGE